MHYDLTCVEFRKSPRAHAIRTIAFARRINDAMEEVLRDAVISDDIDSIPRLDVDASVILSHGFLQDLGEHLRAQHVAPPHLCRALWLLWRALQHHHDMLHVISCIRAAEGRAPTAT